MPASLPQPHGGRSVLWHLRREQPGFAAEFEGIRKSHGHGGTDVECSGWPFTRGVRNGVRKALRAREFVHDRAPFLPR